MKNNLQHILILVRDLLSNFHHNLLSNFLSNLLSKLLSNHFSNLNKVTNRLSKVFNKLLSRVINNRVSKVINNQVSKIINKLNNKIFQLNNNQVNLNLCQFWKILSNHNLQSHLNQKLSPNPILVIRLVLVKILQHLKGARENYVNSNLEWEHLSVELVMVKSGDFLLSAELLFTKVFFAEHSFLTIKYWSATNIDKCFTI